MFLTLLLFTPAANDDALRLRARAALALAATEPTYAGQYARAAAAAKPLVVYVGRPAGAVPGCVCVRWDACPGAVAGVVIGVPAGGGFRRVDLPGEPTAANIWAVASAAPAPEPGPLALPVPR